VREASPDPPVAELDPPEAAAPDEGDSTDRMGGVIVSAVSCDTSLSPPSVALPSPLCLFELLLLCADAWLFLGKGASLTRRPGGGEPNFLSVDTCVFSLQPWCETGLA